MLKEVVVFFISILLASIPVVGGLFYLYRRGLVTMLYLKLMPGILAVLTCAYIVGHYGIFNITIVIAVFPIGITIMLAIFIYVAKTIVKQIKNLAIAAEQMAKGDFSKIADIKSKDEIGQLSEAFAKMTQVQQQRALLAAKIADGDLTEQVTVFSEKDILGNALEKMTTNLNNIIGDLITSSHKVTIGADQVSESSQSLSQCATQQAASLQEMTSSMTEIGAKTAANAENSNAVNQLVIKTRKTGEKSAQQMEAMKAAMKAISDSSVEIGKIINVIDDIAFQTNLLALNAAVEAARAGKHGKGFAVVSQEVRTLAARSAKAAQETTALIEGSATKVADGNSILEKTAKAFEEINEMVGKAAALVAEIAEASNEQSQGISQVNQGLSQIDGVTQQNTANAEETSAAAQELATLAGYLRKILSRFKIKTELQSAQPQKTPTPAAQSAPLKKLAPPEETEWGSIEAKTPRKDTVIVPEPLIALDDDEFGKY